MRRNVWILLPLCAFICLCAFPALVFAQANAPQAAAQASAAQTSAAQTSATQTNIAPSRITQAIDEANLTRLNGNTHPLAQARFDQGAAPDSLPMQRMLLVLKRSAAQESALDALLDQQQDSTSANFHQWLTPQQFGQQFGPSDQDVQTITAWLQSQGFTVAGVSNGRTVIEFSGTAGQVRQAFHTEIHRYTVNGQDRWANSSDPQIPAALTPVVAGINTLYNFPRLQMHQIVGVFNRSRDTGAVTPAPGTQFTFPNPCNPTSEPFCNFALGPADFAKIYNVPNMTLTPAPSTIYNGDNQTIVIVGESDINPADVNAFRTLFGLPSPANLNIIVNGSDPGVNGAETEGDLDTQWAGAVAPNAALDYVVAESTEASLGVDLAAQYAVDNNLGQVLSESYGICELFMGTADNTFYSQLWQQASAEGITVTVSSGDGGSAACDQNVGTLENAQYGLTVSGFTSTPYNVSVGGTDFNDVINPALFWNTTPTTNPATPSALGYIPEMTWNDSCTNQEIYSLFDMATAEQSCNNSQILEFENEGLLVLAGGSGGQSNCTTSDGQTESGCTGGYAKPSWQAGTGVPNDGKRDIPDVSLFASNGFNGTFYIVCEQDVLPTSEQSGASCNPNASISSFIGIGGTSASTPSFAGIVSLVNQAIGSNARQGNANFVLYKLAAKSGASCTSAASPASTCVFYDVPAGSTIAMACAAGSPDEPGQTNSACPIQTPGDQVGVLSGYSTTAGYDLATGLGSVNAGQLISNWKTFNSSLKSSTTGLTLTPISPATSLTGLIHGQPVQAVVNVTGSGGPPTGTVSLMAQVGSGPAQGVASATLIGGSATFSTMDLPGDPTGQSSYTVIAQYSGDATFASSTSASTSVSVAPEASKIQIDYELFNPATGAITHSNSTAPFDAPALLRIDVTSQAGDSCATNGTPVPGNYGCPTGSVAITDNSIALDGGTFVLNSQGYAEDQSVFFGGGTHNIAVTYSGDTSFTASPQAMETITVTPAPTTISLYNPQVDIQFGNPITLTATVATQILGPPTAYLPTGTAGSVQFFVNGTPIQPGPGATITYSSGLTSNGYAQLTAVLTVSTLPLGTDEITAQYNGDQNYAASPISAPTAVYAKINTSVNLSTSNSTIQHGSSVTLTAIVTPMNTTGPGPTGTVQFAAISTSNTGVSLGSATLSEGQASLTTSALPGGSYSVYATYSGDTDYWTSTGNVAETVNLLATATAFVSSASSIQGGAPVTFTATVSPVQTGGPAIGGQLQFYYSTLTEQSNLIIGNPVAVTNGTAQVTTTALPAGTDSVGASFEGDPNYSSSSSSKVPVTVGTITTTTTLTSSNLDAPINTNIVFTVQITPSVSGGPVMNGGTLQLMINGSLFSSDFVAGQGQQQQLTFNYNAVTAGSYQVQAVYSGDSTYNASSSSNLTQKVVSPGFTVSANPFSLTIPAPGQSASTTLAFTSQDGFTGSGGFSSSTCGTSSSEEISCSLTSFTLPANVTATAVLTFKSTAASGLVPTTRRDHFVPAATSIRAVVLSIPFFMIAFAFVIHRKEQRWKLLFGTLMFAVIVSGVSCGGGGGSGGNNPPPNLGTPAGAVSPLTVSITINGVTQTVPNLTLTVN